MSRPRLNLVIAGAIVGFLETVSWDAPYVVPSGAFAGLILGPIVRRLNPAR